jgi:hypothetical protein
MLTLWFGGSDSLDGFFQREHPGGFFRHLQFRWHPGTDPEISNMASKSRTRWKRHPPARIIANNPQALLQVIRNCNKQHASLD